VNNLHTSERRSSRLAFALSCLLHIAAGTLIFFVVRNFAVEQWPSMGPGTANSNVMQIELRPVASVSAQPVLLPTPKPAEVPLEEIQKPPEPQPESVVSRPAEASESQVSAEAQTAQMAQSASASAVQPTSRNQLLDWVRVQIEKEKYYPQAARNAGYEGRFRLLVKIGMDGKISEAAVLDGQGHLLLRRSLEKIMAGLKGRDFGRTLAAPIELPFEFEFKLK
jgi:outer membrane biosynthesis protein TonB